MTIESTRETMMRFWSGQHAAELLHDDVVFTMMATGEEYRGRDAVQGMFEYIYNIAFKAALETRNVVFADGQCTGEWDFVGEHTGEFAGIPATGKHVRVPLCVVYDLEDGLIRRARIYFELPALFQQLNADPASDA